jgi:hypothetical protein
MPRSRRLSRSCENSLRPGGRARSRFVEKQRLGPAGEGDGNSNFLRLIPFE